MFSSCGLKNRDATYISTGNEYANGFKQIQRNGYTEAEIFNPWQNAKNVIFHYIFWDGKSDLPDGLNGKEIIRTPVKRIICLSTTHLGFIDYLNELETIIALSGTRFVNNPAIQDRINKDKIKEIGHLQNLNIEMIIRLKPDIVLAYSIESEDLGYLNKLKELGIKVLYISEYLENTPLGKTEWIKLFGILFDKYEEASQIFNRIENEYMTLKNSIPHKQYKPRVMTGLPWKDTWYVPGGNSYFAHFILDSGGKYIWGNNDLRRSYMISFENVLLEGNEADIWLNTGSAENLSEISVLNEKLTSLKPFKNKQVFNNNAKINKQGGNDFWESAVVKPELVLKDLIRIFHPALLTEYKLTYYKKLQ
ncbi:ABC transporter substrate-binding protein [Bacteroidota bacterium]